MACSGEAGRDPFVDGCRNKINILYPPHFEDYVKIRFFGFKDRTESCIIDLSMC